MKITKENPFNKEDFIEYYESECENNDNLVILVWIISKYEKSVCYIYLKLENFLAWVENDGLLLLRENMQIQGFDERNSCIDLDVREVDDPQ